MDLTTTCTHLHGVTITLGEAETFTVQPPYRGAKPIVVTRVSITYDSGDLASLSDASPKTFGFYAKKDGTASANRVSWPPYLTMADLPPAIRDAFVAAFHAAEHGR